MDQTTVARPAVYIGRGFIALGVLALLGAWITQLTGRPLLGMSQEHLFNDAIALPLLGIAFINAQAFVYYSMGRPSVRPSL